MNMRLVKGFVIAVAGLFISATLISLFIPSRVIVARSVTINAGTAKVFTEVSDLRNWKHWQPVFRADSAAISFSGDSICEWVSKSRTNRIIITARTANSIKATLTREGENTVLNTIRVQPVEGGGQVQAEWNVMIKLRWYPWEKFYGIFIEKISGQGYEDALNSLKEYVEHH